ncbi:MAG: hypothetical protein MR388_02000 [Tenericutes bacterium]|nr:hypothetical protein [Mycoplasmatota bacterium]
MKKKIISLALLIFLATGCFKKGNEDIINSLNKKIDGIETYYIKGELEIINNEDSYLYNVEVAYQKEDKFKVDLVNKTNNHEQIILKDSEGVYLLTPSLNKSFKFQSDWPYNNSQIYLLQTLLKDIKNDEEKLVEQVDGGYKITTSVNYSNNHNLVKQHIYVDDKANITTVEIVDSNDIVKMKMNFEKIDLSATYKNDYFDLNANMKSAETATTSKEIEDVIYPMHVPANTYLKSQDTINLDDGERIILTFAGESPFTIIEQTVTVTDDYEMTTVYGDPELLVDTIGSVTTNSVSFISNGIEYYAVSEVLDQNQLLEVAKSISVLPVGK